MEEFKELEFQYEICMLIKVSPYRQEEKMSQESKKHRDL
jgi:hypothetical protein